MLAFVYGTLTDPDRADAVLEEWRFDGGATLEGLHRVDGRYPTLAPDGSTPGRLLATDEVSALDAYEGVDRGLYVRIAVPVTTPGGGGHDGTDAAVYVGDPDRLDAAATWPGDGPFPERVRRVVAERDVAVRRDAR